VVRLQSVGEAGDERGGEGEQRHGLGTCCE
jgi:hypothetical protein